MSLSESLGRNIELLLTARSALVPQASTRAKAPAPHGCVVQTSNDSAQIIKSYGYHTSCNLRRSRASVTHVPWQRLQWLSFVKLFHVCHVLKLPGFLIKGALLVLLIRNSLFYYTRDVNIMPRRCCFLKPVRLN